MAARDLLAVTGRQCVRWAALPTLLAAAAGLGWLRAFPIRLGNEQAPAAASPALLLPIAVAMTVVVVAALRLWPGFSLRRPGKDLAERLHRGRLGGCGRATLGVLAAQFALTLPLTLLLPWLCGAPTAVRARVELATSTRPLLFADTPTLSFGLPSMELHELQLRPLAMLPRGTFQPTRVGVRVDDRALGTDATFAETRQLQVMPLPGDGARLELAWVEGTLPLVFAPGAVVVLGPPRHGMLGNGAIAALLLLLPTFVAMALATLCGRVAGLPTVLAVAAIALFVQLFGELGPSSPTMLALLRGHWLLAGDVFPAALASLGVGSVAMIAAMLLRPRPRR